MADQFYDFDDEDDGLVIDDAAETAVYLNHIDDVNIQRGINGQPPIGNAD